MSDSNGYVGRSPNDSSVVIARAQYTPTVTTTEFTFVAGYTVGYIEVFLNGVKLIEGLDYNATDGLTVTLDTAAENGDAVEIVAYKAFTLAAVPTTVGIQSGGNTITNDAATLNFIGEGNKFSVNGNTVDIEINTGAAGTWGTYTAGIATNKSVGVNTETLDNPNLTGVGNSLQGIYISNGMIINDNALNGDHYIGTAYNGLMAGPVTINGVVTVDGNFVVV